MWPLSIQISFVPAAVDKEKVCSEVLRVSSQTAEVSGTSKTVESHFQRWGGSVRFKWAGSSWVTTGAGL